MTRTGAGLHTPSTPALHITVAQPLAANGWTTDSKLLGQLVDEGGISSSKLAKIAIPSKDDDARLKSLQQTFAKHDMLQVVGDPTYLQAHYEEMYAPFTQTLSGMFTADWYFEYTRPVSTKPVRSRVPCPSSVSMPARSSRLATARTTSP